MRVALTSDLHGDLPEVPPCDLLVIAGDVCPIQDHDPVYQAEWLHSAFADWLHSAPAGQVIYTAGNHDFVFAQRPDLVDHDRIPARYLQDEGTSIAGWRLWASPWAVELPNWPFTAPDDDLAEFWDEIDPATRLLIVHGPPHGYGDQVIGRRTGDRLHVGSRTLLSAFEQLPRLELVVCGHIHEGYGEYAHGPLRILNVAHMDVAYRPVNPVWMIDLPE
jgi:Icc-related predicted phosphoesterase